VQCSAFTPGKSHRGREYQGYGGKNSTEEHSFDELARGVAEGNLSRGRALKAVGAAFVGGLASLFALPPREAEAGKLSTLWAVVNSNATLANSKGVASVSRYAAVGSYVVKFN
jgi:hypothetical protein